MKTSYRITTVLGIPLEINISWFIILGLVIFTLAKGYFPIQVPNLSLTTYWAMGLVTAILLFICLLLHELSHSVVAKINKLPIAGITLFVFGGVAHMVKEPQTPKVEFKMAIAGPIMSILLSLIFWIASIVAMHFDLPQVVWIITDYLSFFNLAVAIFNMMPGFPLDGGRILRAVIWHFTKNLKKATRIASVFGEGFAILLMSLGILGLITSNFVSGVWFIFLGFFLLEAAQMSYRQLVIKKAFSGLKVKDIMSKNIISVPDNISIRDLIDEYFFRYKHSCFPIIKDDSLLGIVNFHDVKGTSKEHWAHKTSVEIMIPINENIIIAENSPVEEAFQQLAQNGIGRLLVIRGDKLVGILSQSDIVKLFKVKLEADKI